MMPTCPSAPHTHSLSDACLLIGCESEDWLIDRVRNGTFPARRMVRQLRFSDADLQAIIDACEVQSQFTAPQVTSRSRPRIAS